MRRFLLVLLLASFSLVGLSRPVAGQVVRARDSLRGGASPSTSAALPRRRRVVVGTRRVSRYAHAGRETLALPARHWTYRPHPYEGRRSGYTYDPHAEPDAPHRDGLFVGSLRVGYLLGEVGQVDVRLTAVLGIVELFARQRVLFESIAPNGIEALGLGHVGLGLRLARSSVVRARAHLDFTHAEDGVGFFGGAAFGLDVDVYFAYPWALALEVSAGIVGHSWVVEGALSFGVLEGPVELHVGWDVVLFAPLGGGDPIAMTGPSLTCRIWGS
jgi:hypothetical protein